MLKVSHFSETATVQIDHSPVRFPPALEAHVNRAWQGEQERRGKLIFNGRLLSARSVGPGAIVAQVVEYRHLIAQRMEPTLFAQLQVRPLAVSGLLECADGIVFGRRAGAVTEDAGWWELAPSGGMDAAGAAEAALADHRHQVLEELHEELGMGGDTVSRVRPFALVEDTESHVIDIGIGLTSPLSASEVLRSHAQAGSGEYDALHIVPRAQLQGFMDEHARQLVAVSAALLARFLAPGLK